MSSFDIAKLVPSRTAAPTPQQMATRGTVTIPPASLTDDTVTVVLPSYSADYGWPCRWVRQGNALPAIGAECLVLWDETGAGTVVQWAGAGVALPTVADITALDARLDALEAVAVKSGGANITAGTPPTILGQSGGIASVARQGAGITRVTFTFNVADTSHIWATATIDDNSAATPSVVRVSATPATVDIYTWNSAGSAFDRTFMLLWRGA